MKQNTVSLCIFSSWSEIWRIPPPPHWDFVPSNFVFTWAKFLKWNYTFFYTLFILQQGMCSMFFEVSPLFRFKEQIGGQVTIGKGWSKSSNWRSYFVAKDVFLLAIGNMIYLNEKSMFLCQLCYCPQNHIFSLIFHFNIFQVLPVLLISLHQAQLRWIPPRVFPRDPCRGVTCWRQAFVPH